MTDVIRVMLVDDHPIVREGLRTMLMAQETMDVIGEATDGTQAIEMARQQRERRSALDLVATTKTTHNF